MSVHWDNTGQTFVIRFRDAEGRNRRVTVNPKNLTKYEQNVPDNISERVAKRLEQAVLARETAPDGSVRSQVKQKMLWLEVVARYLPPVPNKQGKDKWEARPPEPLVNEKKYCQNQLDRMQRILTCYFPSFLNHGEIRWVRNGKREHHRAEKVYACPRTISSITPEEVATFQIYLQKSYGSADSVKDYMTALKTFLGWCEEKGYIQANPAEGLALAWSEGNGDEDDDDGNGIEYLDEDEVRTLKAVVEGTTLNGPVRVILGLGVRRAEMLRLRWGDINFEKSQVVVRGTKSRNSLRVVPLPDALAKYLRSLPRADKHSCVLSNSEGKPWTGDGLNSAIRRFREAYRLPFHWGFQTLRRTYGSLLVKRGVPIAHVSKVLGHADVRITQKWYIGLSSEDVSPLILDAINRKPL
ncbi:MAG: site-specific integrase [Planctomycetota bacterium]|nr:site-specific integrase [Planctomycetota bacterium]